MVSSLLVFSHVPRLGFIVSLAGNFAVPPTGGMGGCEYHVCIVSNLHVTGIPFPSLP